MSNQLTSFFGRFYTTNANDPINDVENPWHISQRSHFIKMNQPSL